MSGPVALLQRTTSGEVGTAGVPRTVFTVVFAGGSDAATLNLKSGGTSGTIKLTLAAAAGVSHVVHFPGGVMFDKGCWCALTGTGATVSVAYV